MENAHNTLRQDFVHGFTEDLQGYLLDKLDVGNRDAYEFLQELVAEDSATARKRVSLLGMRKRLEDIKLRLDNFR